MLTKLDRVVVAAAVAAIGAAVLLACQVTDRQDAVEFAQIAAAAQATSAIAAEPNPAITLPVA
ncbi:MAG: hypothetical protein WDO68_01670 [Gammaproteobacteria bacterium]